MAANHEVESSNLSAGTRFGNVNCFQFFIVCQFSTVNYFSNKLLCVKDKLFCRHRRYAEIHGKGFVVSWLTGSDPHGCVAGIFCFRMSGTTTIAG